MNIHATLERFGKNEDGAVTVDWVVLSAAIVTVASAIFAVVSPELTNASSYISSAIVSAK